MTPDPKRRPVDKVLRDPTAVRHCFASVAHILLERFEGRIQPFRNYFPGCLNSCWHDDKPPVVRWQELRPRPND
jgi:hypothetical protein